MWGCLPLGVGGTGWPPAGELSWAWPRVRLITGLGGVLFHQQIFISPGDTGEWWWVGVSVFLSCGYSSLSTYGRLAEQRPGLPQDPGPSVHLVQQQPPPPAGILCSFRSVTGGQEGFEQKRALRLFPCSGACVLGGPQKAGPEGLCTRTGHAR